MSNKQCSPSRHRLLLQWLLFWFYELLVSSLPGPCSGHWFIFGPAALEQFPKEAAGREGNDVGKGEARLGDQGGTRALSCSWGVQQGQDTDFWLPGNQAEWYSKVFLTQGNSFWSKGNSSVLVEGSHRMGVEIPVTRNCLVVVVAVSAAQLLLRQKEDSKGAGCVILPTASLYFTLGCASSGNPSSFKPVAITTVQTCRRSWKLLTRNSGSPPHFTNHLHSGNSWEGTIYNIFRG